MPDEPEFTEGGQPIYRHEDKPRDWTPAETVGEDGYNQNVFYLEATSIV